MRIGRVQRQAEATVKFTTARRSGGVKAHRGEPMWLILIFALNGAFDYFGWPWRKFIVVPVGNLRPEILVMQPAQNWHRQRATDGLDSTWDWRVLVQR